MDNNMNNHGQFNGQQSNRPNGQVDNKIKAFAKTRAGKGIIIGGGVVALLGLTGLIFRKKIKAKVADIKAKRAASQEEPAATK